MATKINIPIQRFGRNLLTPRNQRHLKGQFCRNQISPWERKYLSFSSSSSQVLMENIVKNTNIDDGYDASCMVTKITLNRPKANAMGREMIQGLQNCLDILEKGNTSNNNNSNYYNENIDERKIQDSASCRCLVLTSCSDRVFSAGADLKERATMTEDETADFVTLLRNTMERFASLPMPVIAAIDGVAVGGGLELALSADIRIASTKAVLGLPETSLAIIPGAGGTQRLPRLIGASRAKELIWTGRKLNGNEAKEYGLVTDVVPTGSSATEHAVQLAFKIAANGPVAIRASKTAIDKGGEQTCMKEALDIERQCYEKVLPTQDRLEGLMAFKEGRNPSYKGQ